MREQGSDAAAGPARSFGSLLSVGEQAALLSIGARPRRAVLGVSVLQSAEGEVPGRVYGGAIVPLWHQERLRAIQRLVDQAREVRADLVLGLSVVIREVLGELTEIRAMGTAVLDRGLRSLRRDGDDGDDGELASGSGPVLAAIGAGDYVALRQSGFAPVGTVYDARRLLLSGNLGRSSLWQFGGNRENRKLSDAISAGRKEVRRELTAQGRRLHGHGLVALSVTERPEINDSVPMLTLDGHATAVVQVERFARIERRDRSTGRLLQTHERWQHPRPLPGFAMVQPLDDTAAARHLMGQPDPRPDGALVAIDSAIPGD